GDVARRDRDHRRCRHRLLRIPRRAEAGCGGADRAAGGGRRDRRNGGPAAAQEPDALALVRRIAARDRREAPRLMGVIVLAIVLGFAGGVLAGLFGVGGGILFVPTLSLGLGLTQIHAEATSLLAILPTVAAGTWRQARYGNVRWRPAA